MNAGDNNQAMLRATDLRFGYAAGPQLQCPSHVWHAGLHLVQGDEGVGKTALLCTIAGDLKPRSGELKHAFNASGKPQPGQVFWQHPRTALSEAESKTISREWVAARAPQYPHWSSADFDRHVEAFGLQEHMHKPLLALSTGSLRKLWMAAAWASGAEITLIDEPVAALDRPSERYVEQALNAFTHDAQVQRNGKATRCVIVANWDEMGDVDWDEVLTLT